MPLKWQISPKHYLIVQLVVENMALNKKCANGALIELDDGAGRVGGDFGVDAQNRLHMHTDVGVDDGL